MIAASASSDRLPAELVRSLETAVHDLGQPLTSIAFAISISMQQAGSIDCRPLLQAADAECGRAILQTKQIQVIAAELLACAGFEDAGTQRTERVN